MLPEAYRSASPDMLTAEGPGKTDGVHADEEEILNGPSYRKRRRFLPFHAKTTGDLEAMLGNGQTPHSSLARLLKPRSLVVGSFDASTERALMFL